MAATPQKPSHIERLMNWSRSPASSPQTPRTEGTPQIAYGASPTLIFPRASFCVDDKVLVFELGARHMQAGLAGEAHPRYTGEFGPRRLRLANDSSQLFQNATNNVENHTLGDGENWGEFHELWQLYTRSTDLGLLGDRIEKAIREAILNNMLVLDATSRRITLVLPTILSHTLLSTILLSIFNLYPAPSSITLVPSSLSCAFAAGLRSAIIVDVGWHETVVCAIYEYREVLQRRSCRAMKVFGWVMNGILQHELEAVSELEQKAKNGAVSFEETEEILRRMAWCRPESPNNAKRDSSDPPITIPLHSVPGYKSLTIPFSRFSEPAETVFFDLSTAPRQHDDHELPIHFLAYTVLLALPPDVRQVCLPRMVITGAGSKIPGFKGRLVAEISHLKAIRGWNKVHNYGSAGGPPQRRTALRATSPVPVNQQDPKVVDTTSAHQQHQISDANILSALRARKIPSIVATTPLASLTNAPAVGAIETLGPWAGASLLSGLDVHGVVEIKREEFMKHGLKGAERKKLSSSVEAVPPRPAILRRATGQNKSDGDGTAWSLGNWG